MKQLQDFHNNASRSILAGYALFTHDPDGWIERLLALRPHRNTGQEKHKRNVALFKEYWMTDASYVDLAEKYSLSPVRVRVIARHYLLMIYKLHRDPTAMLYLRNGPGEH